VTAIRGRDVLTVLGITAWMVLCDHFFHVDTRTVIHYWTPQIDGQTVWVAGFFALGAAAIVAIAPRQGPPRPLRWWAELALLTLLYGVSGWFGQAHATAVTAGFAALFAVRFAVDHDRRTILRLALLLGIAGPLFESLTWKLGVFAYSHPDVLGVPWWLFAFYANAAWATRELGATLRRRAPVTANAP